MFVLKMIKNEYLFFQVTIDVFFSGHGVLTSFLYYTLVTWGHIQALQQGTCLKCMFVNKWNLIVAKKLQSIKVLVVINVK